MRRTSLVLLAGTLVLVGCNAARDAFSARADVIARANDQTLSVERVAGWVGSSKQVPLEPLALSRLSHVWVDYALFAQAMAAGKDLRDSATMTAAMWPVVSQLKWERFHDRLVASGGLTGQQVDSAFAAGQFRMFQHILIQVPPNSTPDVDAQKRRRAEQLLPQARTSGARFGQLASRYSDDPGSKVHGGSLGLSPRGQFVPAFEDAAWQLGPGEVSPVVKSPFGYHIIRRPPLSEVRDTFRVKIQDQTALHTDSVYLDSLSIKRRIAPVGRAPAYVRAAVQDLDASRSSNRVLVDYRGGSLRVRHLVRWLSAMDPQVMQALPQATDDQIKQFLKAITQRDLVIQQAESAKVTLTPEDWQQVRAEHDSAIMMLGSILNLSAQMLRDSTPSPGERTNVAMSRVNDYLDRVLQGRARYFPIPPALAEMLRDQGRWSVDEAGVRRAVERAQQIRASADSSRPNEPRMTPAPGPAPIDTTPPGGAGGESAPEPMRLLLTLLAACAVTQAAAQQPAQQSIDRIVAVVGTRPILASQIEEEMVQAQAQGQTLPPDSAGRTAMRRQILDRLIELELLVQQAQRDTSIKVTDQEVLDQVEQTYQNVRKQFSTETEFRDQIRQARFGSVEEWRRWLADQQRRELYAQRLIEAQRQKGKLRPIPPTEVQMREFWEQNRAQQPRRPATVSFRQIVIKPVPDSVAKRIASQRAESLVVELRRGADFAAAAKRFSGDSASAAQGGELGWFRRGVMVKEFEDMAFRLRPGEISPVVETAFGFHIIKVERTQPAEILARHILVVPEISAAQVALARRLADSLHDALARPGASSASFDSLAKLFADPLEPKLAEDAPLTELPPEYQQIVSSDTTRGLKPVIVQGGTPARQKFAVLEITGRHDAGDLAFDDVKLRIRQSLGEQLAIRHFIDQLKRQTYIDIRL